MTQGKRSKVKNVGLEFGQTIVYSAYYEKKRNTIEARKTFYVNNLLLLHAPYIVFLISTTDKPSFRNLCLTRLSSFFLY